MKAAELYRTRRGIALKYTATMQHLLFRAISTFLARLDLFQTGQMYCLVDKHTAILFQYNSTSIGRIYPGQL